jgi:homogentisate 1,2-dioxygenase
MTNKAFYSSDGDFLIVPQTGKHYIQTEFGKLVVEPLEICIIPRGIRFTVNVAGPVRGWVAEIFKGHFVIPSLGR